MPVNAKLVYDYTTFMKAQVNRGTHFRKESRLPNPADKRLLALCARKRT